VRQRLCGADIVLQIWQFVIEGVTECLNNWWQLDLILMMP